MKVIFIILIFFIFSIIYKIIKYTIYDTRYKNKSNNDTYEVTNKNKKQKHVKFADEVNRPLETLIPPDTY